MVGLRLKVASGKVVLLMQLFEDAEFEKLIQALFDFVERADVSNKEILWKQVPKMSQALSAYSPEVIRSYLHLSSGFWFVRGFVDYGDYFVVKGLTPLVKQRKAGRRGSKLDLVIRFALCWLAYELVNANKEIFTRLFRLS